MRSDYLNVNAEQTVFIELLKTALFKQEAIIPDTTDWDSVYEIARNHCVVALIEPFVPLVHKDRWKEVAYNSKARFIQILYEQNKLIDQFNANNVPIVVLKGTAAAMYYPIPTNRTMGDIDLLVLPEDFAKASELLTSAGYRFISDNGRHRTYEKHGVEFELHRRVSSELCKDIDNIVINGLKNLEKYNICNNCFPGLPKYENGLVLLHHILQHIKGEGIGFRQIIDWMMFVNKELDDDSWNNYFKHLAYEAGLENTAVTVTCMCKRWLGLTNEISWCNDADYELVDNLLVQIFNDGNFSRKRTLSENLINVNNSIKREGLFHYLQRSGLYYWKATRDYSFLRPFAWIYQLGRCFVKGISGLINRKMIVREYKQTMNFDEIISRLENE